MLDMVLVFLNLLRIILWPSSWSIMENVPCPLEKMCIVLFEWNVLQMFIKYICYLRVHVLLNTIVSLLIFNLDNLFIDINGVLTPPTIVLLFYICYYLLYVFRCSYVRCLYVYRCYILFLDLPFYHFVIPFCLLL